MKNFVTRFVTGALLILGMTFGVASSANAQTFVGSWDVFDGPSWSGSPPNGPFAYTGQEAAALLFGGSPGDYFISTVDSNVANINHSAWYDVIGHGGEIFAEDYFSKYQGQFYGPTDGFSGDVTGPASAFVQDNLFGENKINYAFRAFNDQTSPVPEPETYAMMIAGLGLLGAMARRRKQKESC